jgi:hypothetical protein
MAQLAPAPQTAVGKRQTGTHRQEGQLPPDPGRTQGQRRRQEQEQRSPPSPPPQRRQCAAASAAAGVAVSAQGEGPQTQAEAKQGIHANVRGGSQGGSNLHGHESGPVLGPASAAARHQQLYRKDGGAACGIHPSSAGLICVTWNASNLGQGTRELDLINLVRETKADVITVTETEIPSTAAEFKINGFVTFSPLTVKGGKLRVLVLLREDVTTQSNARVRKDLMAEAVLSVWVQMDAHWVGRVNHAALLQGGIYCQWSDGQEQPDQTLRGHSWGTAEAF